MQATCDQRAGQGDKLAEEGDDRPSTIRCQTQALRFGAIVAPLGHLYSFEQSTGANYPSPKLYTTYSVHSMHPGEIDVHILVT